MQGLENILRFVLSQQIWPIADNQISSALRFNVTLKLIAFDFTCDYKTVSLVCVALETDLPKIIITGSNLTDIPEKYRIHRGLHFSRELDGILPPVGAFCFSPHAENAFIDLNHPAIPDAVTKGSELIQINSDFKSLQLRGRMQFPFNMNPQRVHHILVGKEPEIAAGFNLPSMKVLKYKTGIVFTSARTKNYDGIMVERYLGNSRDSKFVKLNIENFGAPYQDQFGILRHRRFIVDTYPSRLHVLYDAQKRPVAGLTYNIVKSQADHFNFTFEYKMEGWRSVGQNPNGTWNGFIGSFIDDRIDVAMWLSASRDRSLFCEVPLTALYETFGIIKPIPAESVNWYAMLYLLEPEVWLCTGISCILITLVFHAYSSIPGKYANGSKPSRDSFYFSLMAPLNMYLRQAADLPNDAKLSSIIFLFSSIVVGVFFESNLMAFITLPEREQVPSTVEELTQAPNYKIGYVLYKGSTPPRYFKETDRPAVKAILPRLTTSSPRDATQLLMRTALEPQTVTLNYHVISMAAVAANLTIYPKMYPVERGEALLGVNLGPVFRKYSKLVDAFTANMMALDQTGHFTKWSQEAFEISRRAGSAWLQKERMGVYQQLKAMAWNILYPTVKPFTFHNFAFSFLCLAIGTTLSLLAFGGEINARTELRGWQSTVEHTA